MVDISGIDRVLKRAAESGDVPGVAAAAANADGVFYSGAFGTRDLATGAPMTSDTVVWIASLSKAVTGVAAMQLVEQGKLSLDAPIKTILPQMASVQVIDGVDASGAARLRPPKRDITLRNLLTHTSGFVYDIWDGPMAAYMEKQGIPGIISCMNAALTIPLAFDPGEKWQYGIGIDIAGKAIEAVSGKTLGAYLKDNLFEPLGMKDTGFKIGDAQRARLAKIHARTPGGLVSTDTEITQTPEFEMGGGGLYGTVGDYLTMLQMLMHGGAFNGARVLKPETVALMSQNAMGDVNVRALKTAMPPYSNDVDFIDGMKWGLTFLINPQQLPSGRSPGSLAWAGLANCYYWLDPKRKLTGVYATQILPFFDAKSVAAFDAFEAEVYKAH